MSSIFAMRVALDKVEQVHRKALDKIDALTRERDLLAARLDDAEAACKSRSPAPRTPAELK